MNLTFLANIQIVDVILLLIMAGFVFYGLWFGLIKTIGSLAGVVVGTWAASHFYLILYNFAKPLAFGHEALGINISFIICFVIASCLVNFLFAILNKVFNVISIIPFLKTINRLGGALFGFFEGALVLGLLVYVIGRYIPNAGWFFGQLKGSQLIPFLLDFSKILTPLMPEILKHLKSVL